MYGARGPTTAEAAIVTASITLATACTQVTRRTTMRELWAAIAHAEGWGARSEAEYVLYNSPMEHTRTVSAIMADATPDSDDDENFTW